MAKDFLVAKKYTLKHLIFDFEDHKVWANGVELTIDHKAVEVFKLLAENAGKTIHIDDFMDKVWADKPSAPEVVTAAIARLRKILKMTGLDDQQIVTVHKIGYRFEPKLEPIEKQPSHIYNWLWLLLGLLIVSLAINFKQYFTNTLELNLKNSNAFAITAESASDMTQIYVLRHTEKSSYDESDPDLSEYGVDHAKYWKSVLQHIKFDRIYTTDFKRNIKTAAIISKDSGVKTEIYHPMSFEVLKFINKIKGQKVLIIGHSNTIPDMVNRIIGESKYPPMNHKNYNTLHLVTIDKNGDTASTVLNIKIPQ